MRSENRIEDLDVVRGLALCGIHVVNVYQQVVLPQVYPEGIGFGLAELPDAVRYGFYERFLPLFTLLFGVSAGIFLTRAARRTDRPRVVLARRLAALAVLGGLHQLAHPGEVLLVYAVLGLVVLLPASWLTGTAACLTGGALVLVGGQLVPGYGMMPGLLVLGLGLARRGVPEGLGRHPGRVAATFAACTALAVAYVGAISAGVAVPTLSWGWSSLTGQLVGVCTGVAYATGTVLLLRTRAGGVLRAMLAPMGRAALTNYLLATALMLGLAGPLGIDGLDDGGAIAVLVLLIVVAEAAGSAWWLRRFRYGPVEWVWRCVTWWERVPLRRAGRGDDVGAEVVGHHGRHGHA